MEPKQKPGRSKQDYGTPPELLAAVLKRLGLRQFDCDLAASPHNAVHPQYIDAEHDALALLSWHFGRGWNWLNPPFSQIGPWVERAYKEARRYPLESRTAVLIPAAVGSNWWRDWVHDKCSVHFLNPRLTFVGCKDPYPKDCALLLYGFDYRGYEVWQWKAEAKCGS